MTVKYNKTGRTIKWTTPNVVTEDEAKELQTNEGYSPYGYGFFDYEVSDFETNWKSWSNCD